MRAHHYITDDGYAHIYRELSQRTTCISSVDWDDDWYGGYDPCAWAVDRAENLANDGKLAADGHVEVPLSADMTLSGRLEHVRVLPEHFTVEVS